MSEHKGGISESTIARMAGNIAGGLFSKWHTENDIAVTPTVCRNIAAVSVTIARAIAAEVHRTAPVTPKEGS